jgi:radical SAM enzyme (TIGR01210 family)
VLDPDRPYAYLSEREPKRDALGKPSVVDVSTVFLTASRCSVGCSMCDLHRNTLSGPTAVGAIVRQIRYAQLELPRANWIKLFNSGNFFDAASIPVVDYPAIAAACADYERVIVENHPRFGKSRHQMVRDLLPGRLEIAVGLETVQPRMLGRLGKQMTRDEFDRYARFLAESEIDLRVFLIFGAPDLSIAESIRWARLSVRHAIRAGARHISLIPARAGHGWNGMADSLPTITLPDLIDLFVVTLNDSDRAACLSVDLWDIDPDALGPSERERLQRFQTAIVLQDASEL